MFGHHLHYEELVSQESQQSSNVCQPAPGHESQTVLQQVAVTPLSVSASAVHHHERQVLIPGRRSASHQSDWQAAMIAARGSPRDDRLLV